MIVLSFITNFFARFFPVAITIILCILCPYKRHVSRTGLLLPKQQFQSTHLVWDATCKSWVCPWCKIHFNPRTSYEMRLSETSTPNADMEFQSTHLVWDATVQTAVIGNFVLFQSTHLVWDATSICKAKKRKADISIHAPRMRCDLIGLRSNTLTRYFNPRTSYEMRLLSLCAKRLQ